MKQGRTQECPMCGLRTISLSEDMCPPCVDELIKEDEDLMDHIYGDHDDDSYTIF